MSTVVATCSRDRTGVLLARLGDTEDAVAASLRQAGVRGHRGDACACPVAVFLRRRGVPVEEVQPDWFDGSVVRFERFPVDGRWHEPKPAHLPSAVRKFARAFDGGAYPDLELP